MRVDLKKLMEKLGVPHVLSPYETCPWYHYDAEKGVTCSAEVRMGPSGDDIEAEIQLVYDEGKEPPPDIKPAPSTSARSNRITAAEMLDEKPIEKKEEEGKGGNQGGQVSGGPRQIMRMRATPADGFWTPRDLLVKGENFVNKIHNWEEKCCDFFRSCIQALQMGQIPNIDELIAKELNDDDDMFGGKRGRIGRKAPKIKPAALLGMKKGM